MGRKSRDKKQKSEASTPDQSHNEEAQQDEPIDPDQEQVILPDPEEQNDPEPNPQQEEIHQDPPEDPLPNPSQEEQVTHQDSQDDPEQNQDQEENVYQHLQKHPEQEKVNQDTVVEQGVPPGLNAEVPEQQESLIAELDSENHYEKILQLSQESFQGETELATIIMPTSHENSEQEVETLAVPLTLEEERQETEVKTHLEVPSSSEESVETGLQAQAAVVSRILQQSPAQEVVTQARANPVSKGGPKQDIEINIEEKEKRNETSINLKGENDEIEQHGQSCLIKEDIEVQDEAYPCIVPTVSNFSRPSFDEAIRESLEQDHQNNFQASESILALRLLRRLLGLENITEFPALEGPNLIELQPTQRLSSLTDISLPLFPENSSSGSLPELHDCEAEMRSELQNREDLEQADRSGLSSQSHAEAPDTLTVSLRKPMKARERKRKKQREPSRPGYADSIESNQLLEYENSTIEDPGKPDFADPRELIKLIESENAELSSPDELEFSVSRELLKDLNFGEMKADNQETKLAGNLKLETIVNLETEDNEDLKTEVSGYSITGNSGNLETEGREELKTETEGDSRTEVDENLETEADTYLETGEDEDLEMENYEDLEMDNHGLVAVEVCEPPLPPPEDGNSLPDDVEDSLNALPPNDKIVQVVGMYVHERGEKKSEIKYICV